MALIIVHSALSRNAWGRTSSIKFPMESMASRIDYQLSGLRESKLVYSTKINSLMQFPPKLLKYLIFTQERAQLELAQMPTLLFGILTTNIQFQAKPIIIKLISISSRGSMSKAKQSPHFLGAKLFGKTISSIIKVKESMLVENLLDLFTQGMKIGLTLIIH